MATNEMRAWLEEKIKHIEKFIKAYPGSIDIKKARKDMEMMQAILAELEPKVTEAKVKEWFEKNAPCTCDKAYTSRGLTAPDCLRHQGLDAEDLIRMLKDLGILAALSEREPVTEEERKGMFNYFYSLIQYESEWNSPKCQKLRNFILGHAAGEGGKQ